MVQFTTIVLIVLVLAIVACSAKPPRYRQQLTAIKLQPLRRRPAVQQQRVFARQEVVTPYPTADELKPEVPFEDGNIPDEVYGPPDETYGPPQIDQTPADQLPSEEAPEEFASSADVEEFQSAGEEPVSRLTSRTKHDKKNISHRFVQNKKGRNLQRLVVAQAKVVAPSASFISSKLPLSSASTAQSQQYYISNNPFAYTARYQVW